MVAEQIGEEGTIVDQRLAQVLGGGIASGRGRRELLCITEVAYRRCMLDREVSD